MSSESWPPQLKEWVAKCLGQITDSNRSEVQAELKQVIAEAFSARTLWTTDWNGVQLQSLLPKPVPTFNALKRKSMELPGNAQSKKAKKAAAKNQAANIGYNSGYSIDIEQAALNRRAERFQREHELERTKASRNGAGQSSLKGNHQNVHLFKNSKSSSPYGTSATDEPEGDPNVIDWDRFTIVGTSQEIFKDYLRLTSEPNPETIRPYHILQQTFSELKTKWRNKTTYNWICNQFKSLRQDLTVQRIKNEFTVQVYEVHARIALESNDMVEYNQCQATLKILYELGIPGKVEEFTAYRILMLLHGQNRSELNLLVGQLTAKQKANAAVRHALDVQRAMAMGNYHRLCDLYLTAPHMGAYIMDHFIDRERVKALMVITKAYKTLPLSFIQNSLGFDATDDLRTFLSGHNLAVFSNPNSPESERMLDCKAIAGEVIKVYQEKYRRAIIKGAI
ncbi:SAC3/GANP/Nin1/mts3/eIF-3 p25 family-domain-containing protein [Panaeolus papilionaceus]|nr:SAC3/GANP/Nin1/mts3/eIF-3 p25 family-domain-containing protein [Panaeolus papilionaceus]